MTKEDAKDYIREWCPYDKQDEIIKALEQEPKTIQEKQAESEKYDKAFEDGYEHGYAQAWKKHFATKV